MILTRKNTKELSGVMELFYNLMWVMITWVNASIKIHQAVYLRYVHFIMYKLCLHLKKYLMFSKLVLYI